MLIAFPPALVAQNEMPAPAPAPAPELRHGGDLGSRRSLTGDWGGARDALEDHGLTVLLDATYTFQGVADGGLSGPLFQAFSDEDDTGHTVSATLLLGLDTEKAGLWAGGSLEVAVDARAGRSVVERAGSVSAVNNDALFPNVVDRFDDEVAAVTELLYTHWLAESWGLFGGLLNAPPRATPTRSPGRRCRTRTS